MEIMPLSPALGARVTGLEAASAGDNEISALRRALLQYHVIVIPGEVLGDDDYVRFGKGFGECEFIPIATPLASRPEIMAISNIRDETGKALGRLPDGEMSFHYDTIYTTSPNIAGILHAVEIPSHGGDTCFSNMCLAYDTLPAPLKAAIEGRQAMHSYCYGATAPGDKAGQETFSAMHPLVRTIPETGRKALYVCRLMTDRIEGLPDAESRALLATLFDHIERPEFIYRHRWSLGDILIWDNRCTTHARTDFPASERRLLKRLTVTGMAGTGTRAATAACAAE